MLVALVLIAAALAVGAVIGSNEGTRAPARPASESAVAVARESNAPGLIKGGLQPRPYSPIAVDEPATGGRAPDGFVRMPGGEVRPVPGS
jgi:hypothetical protein